MNENEIIKLIVERHERIRKKRGITTPLEFYGIKPKTFFCNSCGVKFESYYKKDFCPECETHPYPLCRHCQHKKILSYGENYCSARETQITNLANTRKCKYFERKKEAVVESARK